jgi:hypothetical protein
MFEWRFKVRIVFQIHIQWVIKTHIKVFECDVLMTHWMCISNTILTNFYLWNVFQTSFEIDIYFLPPNASQRIQQLFFDQKLVRRMN